MLVPSLFKPSLLIVSALHFPGSLPIHVFLNIDVYINTESLAQGQTFNDRVKSNLVGCYTGVVNDDVHSKVPSEKMTFSEVAHLLAIRLGLEEVSAKEACQRVLSTTALGLARREHLCSRWQMMDPHHQIRKTIQAPMPSRCFAIFQHSFPVFTRSLPVRSCTWVHSFLFKSLAYFLTAQHSVVVVLIGIVVIVVIVAVVDIEAVVVVVLAAVTVIMVFSRNCCRRLCGVAFCLIVVKSKKHATTMLANLTTEAATFGLKLHPHKNKV